MDGILAQPGEIGQELRRIYADYEEDWKKEKTEQELASDSFIRENYAVRARAFV